MSYIRSVPNFYVTISVFFNINLKLVSPPQCWHYWRQGIVVIST